MTLNHLLSALAIALTFIAFIPYIRAILAGATRPHLFSWVIWGSTTFVAFLAQLSDHGGAGAWPIGVSGILTLIVAGLAFGKRGDRSITGSDWGFFVAAMSALPLWYLTRDPLWAVVVLTTVDLLGFGPTLRKGYRHPFEESPLFFAMFGVRNLLAVAALEHYSLTTALFPAALGLACFLGMGMIVWRRSRMAPSTQRGIPKNRQEGGF
ncbi:MAG: hypothetical protein COX57_00615 [Alphaproteobacteria bacterium CG_4_10_14_0_2_um_filter_63_37]|nr:MAG: hypothetical protein AUJ55_05395 [Proteobacteria bacterium CG1_02_64_396]PJA25979.1 MAG: hypothetical protein COX57_00615 [Alphaproteobacteria bacterium CG_4_10_14_0_2_um_filter_63_37]